MKAIVRDQYGSPDVLMLQEIPQPVVRDREVLVRVRAASLNVADWLALRGRPYAVRPAFGGLRRPNDRLLGKDVAGAVAAVGSDVQRFQVGDEVFGLCEGSFAEYVATTEDALVRKPAGLTFDQAAAVPLAAATALRNLRDIGQVRHGQQVLINGAAGGVGTFAVQIAKWLGAEVTGVCSTRNLDLVRSIGAEHVIDYTQEDFTTCHGRHFDVILDNVMNHSLSGCRHALTPEGTLILNNGTTGGAWIGPLGRMALAVLLSRFIRQKVRLAVLPSKTDLVVLKERIEAGDLTPVIDRTYPLAETAGALRYLGSGHARGKVVISV
jgi:NADPH:quinone reductase-like Zn-dependent oxidoreductase